MVSVLRCRAIARILMTAVLMFFSFCFASTAQAAPDNTGPTELSITATTGDASSVQVSWKPPADLFAQITAYSLRLDNNQVAEFKVINGLLPSTYVISSAPFNPGGDVTVVALSGTAQVGIPSNVVTLSKSTTAAPLTTSAEAPKPSSYSGNGFGGALQTPPYADTNQPTPLEAYGSGSGIRSLVSTNNDGTQWISASMNGVAGAFWALAVLLQLAGSAIFGWALIKSIYGALVGAVLALLNSFSTSPLFGDILLIAVAVTMGWGAIMLLKDEDRIRKGIGGAFLVLLACFTFLGNVTSLVPQLVQMPVTVTQFTMAEISKWEIPGDKPEDYNLSIKPTYNGNELEQSIRRYLNQNWLQTTYPAFCQVNFGDVPWSTTNFVPNDKAMPTYNNLTFCEYLLKAQTENNTVALDKLRSDDTAGGAVGTVTGGLIGHREGYVEKASPAIWKNYQASAVEVSTMRVLFSGAALGSNFIDFLMKLGLGLFISLTVLLLGVDTIVLGFLLIAGVSPPLLGYLERHLREMAAKTWKPGLVMALFMIVDKIVSIIFTAGGVRGWLAETILRCVTMVAILTWGLYKIFRRKQSSRASGQRGTPPTPIYDPPSQPNSPGPSAPPSQPGRTAPPPVQDWYKVQNSQRTSSSPKAIAGSPAVQGTIVAHQGYKAISSGPSRPGNGTPSPKGPSPAPSRTGSGHSGPRATPPAPRR